MQWNVTLVGCSQIVLVRISQRHQVMNSVRNRLHSGNPRSTTNREDRYTTNIALHTRTPITRPLHHNLRTVTGTQLSDPTIPNCLIQPYPTVWSNHTQLSDPTIPNCLIQMYPTVWSNHTQLTDTSRCSRQAVPPPLRPRHRMAAWFISGCNVLAVVNRWVQV